MFCKEWKKVDVVKTEVKETRRRYAMKIISATSVLCIIPLASVVRGIKSPGFGTKAFDVQTSMGGGSPRVVSSSKSDSPHNYLPQFSEHQSIALTNGETCTTKCEARS